MDYKYNKRKHDSITHKRKHDPVIYVFFLMCYNGLSMAFKRTCSSTRTNEKKNSVSRGSATIVMLEQRRIKAI